MLILISIGLNDEKDMSLKALEAARECEMLFLETYTTRLETTREKLEKLIGKKIEEIERKDLEEGCTRILEDAKDKKIGILVGGDCLVATTHLMLVIEARRRGIPVEIIHGSSVFSAVAETGLHLKKFGPYVTIPFSDKTKGVLPVSVYETISENISRGLHTLCFLDIAERCMTVKDALEVLLSIERELKKNILNEDTHILVCSKLGSPRKRIEYMPIKDLMREEFDLPAVLLIPGNLHFTEKEAISFLCLSGKQSET